MVDFNTDGHLGTVRFGRFVDRRAAERLIEAAAGNDELLACSVFLWDFTGSELDLDTNEMRELKARFRDLLPRPSRRRKVALVTDRSTTRSKLMILRALFGRSGQAEYRLFERPSAARVWLALRPHWTNNHPTIGQPVAEGA